MAPTGSVSVRIAPDWDGEVSIQLPFSFMGIGNNQSGTTGQSMIRQLERTF